MHDYNHKLCIIINVFKLALMVAALQQAIGLGITRKILCVLYIVRQSKGSFVPAGGVRTEATWCVAQRTLISAAKRVCMSCMP